MPKVQIPQGDAQDSKKVVEQIQKAVQDQLSRGGASNKAAADGIYIKF